MKTARGLIIPACCLCLSSLLFISGCQMKKQTGVNNEEAGSSENVQYETVKIDFSKADTDKIITKFTGDTLEKALKNGAKSEKYDGFESLTYENGTQYFTYTERTFNGLGPVITYKDQYEMAGEQYEGVLSDITYDLTGNNVFGIATRKKLPDESLDNCTREEALNYCNQYAELLGYGPGNSTADVYAITIDKLKDTMIPCYGPLKGIDNKKILSDDKLGKIQEKYPWTKEYEAMYIIYKPCVNGMLLDSIFCSMEMVYVPAYGKIVYAVGYIPWTVTGTEPLEDKIISKEEAVEEAKLLSNTADKDNIKIEDVTMVYSQNMTRLGDSELDLCWRVYYKIENSAEYTGAKAYKSVLINAVTGEEYYINS